MATRSDTFGRLLKAGIGSIAVCEGKNAPIIEDELGEKIGLSGDTIQRYKAGHLPPDIRTVQILAEAAVQRGFMSREWLKQFLHAAHYPFTNRLLDRLCPLMPTTQRPPRAYENLPPPPYSQFIMRPQAYSDMTDGLNQRSAVVLIYGLSGNGKTSLARELAARCLQADENVPRFDAVIWVSDKDQPGTTTLNIVLDEIASILDYPGYIQFELEDKRHEIEQLLRRMRVLLVVDNFETITDETLLTWLLRLPEPSKAIITTREYRREFRSSWPVELRGMSVDEAQELIQQRLRSLRIERLVDDRALFKPLIEVTGGNPKAIEVALGLIKYEHRPLQEIVNDLFEARGELFNELFERAWHLLDQAARRVLLVMPLFSTSASHEAITITANVHGFALAQAVERLADLALLDIRRVNLSDPARYAVHPLVRAFTAARLAELSPLYAMKQRERWMNWCIQLVKPVGYCWQDLSKLDTLDNDEETIFSVLKWAYGSQHYEEVLQVAQGFEYYYFIRGIWKQKLEVDEIRAEAANRVGNIKEEILARSSLVHVLSLQHKVADAASHLPRLHKLMGSEVLGGDTLYVYQDALALYYRAQSQSDMEEQILRKLMEMSEQFTVPRQINACLGLADYQYRKSSFIEARQLFRTALQTAKDHNFQRSIAVCQLKLAEIDLAQNQLEAAEQGLATSLEKAREYTDWRCIAEVQSAYARLHTIHGDKVAAYVALEEAIDFFERLGMRRSLIRAQAAQAELRAVLNEAGQFAG